MVEVELLRAEQPAAVDAAGLHNLTPVAFERGGVHWIAPLALARRPSAREEGLTMGDVARVDLAAGARLAGMPRWRLRLRVCTRQFIAPSHTDAPARWGCADAGWPGWGRRRRRVPCARSRGPARRPRPGCPASA